MNKDFVVKNGLYTNGNTTIHSIANSTPASGQSWNGQLKIDGYNHSAGIALDANTMWIGSDNVNTEIVLSSSGNTKPLSILSDETVKANTRISISSGTDYAYDGNTWNGPLTINGINSSGGIGISGSTMNIVNDAKNSSIRLMVASNTALVGYDLYGGLGSSNIGSILTLGTFGIGSNLSDVYNLYISKLQDNRTNTIYNPISIANYPKFYGKFSEISGYRSSITLGATANTSNTNYVYHYLAGTTDIATGSYCTSQYGFLVSNTMNTANNNFAFYSGVTRAANDWNLYMVGTANNYIGGQVSIGTTSMLPVAFTLRNYGQMMIGAQNDVAYDPVTGYGHLSIQGSGYTGFISLDPTAMQIGHNSSGRDLILVTSGVGRISISGSSGICDTSGVTVSTKNAFGYSAGAGGSVTQLTSKSTSVTLNAKCGRITTHAASLASNSVVSFTWNNTYLGSSDVVIMNQVSGSTGYYLYNVDVGSATATISIRNLHTAALAEAIIFQFAIISGSLS